MTPTPARRCSRVVTAALLATCGVPGCGSVAGPTSTARLFATDDSSASVARPVPQSPRVEDDADPKTADVMPVVQPPAVDRAVSSTTDVAPPAQPAAAAVPPVAAVGGGGRAFMIVGGVVAKVNETPIYAHTVFAHLDRELAAQARTRDRDGYAAYAEIAIGKELHELIRNEELYLEALRQLTDDERHAADGEAVRERDRLVKQAGGSAQEAIRRSAADGYDFDEKMEDYHRQTVIDLFHQRHVYPLISISATDMLADYHANVGKLYTRKPSARYRVIKFDPRDQPYAADPAEAARLKAELARLKAVRGDDFAALAAAENVDPFLKKYGGDPNASTDPAKPAPPVGPGTYVVDAVDGAIWGLKKAGDVTPVVAAEGSYYVAKLVERTDGQVRAFDAPGVQEDIYERLLREQARQCERRFEEASGEYVVPMLSADSVPMLMDMAMQKYAAVTGRP